MYFLASQPNEPKIKEVFRTTTIDGINVFITSERPNYWYIYKESTLKYIITANKAETNQTGDVNMGDHLTFGAISLKDKSIIVKTHRTRYNDIGNYNFDISWYPCNFTLKDDMSDDLSVFKIETKCEEIGMISTQTLETAHAFDPHAQTIIHLFCKILLGRSSGGCKKQYKTFQGKRYLLRNMNTKTPYILVKNKKHYIQHGGIPQNYKGITFFTENFITFLGDYIFKPLIKVKTNLESI